ncbi:hypothetical protein FZC66_14100 [Priestia megaterium]|nr:hypothetical protein FZC66_14100 [Priestia megaterium]
MLKKLFSFNNPISWISAAALILALSPEARKGTRKLLVKGTGAVLSLGDSVKTFALGSREEVGKFLEDAKAEKEQINIPVMLENSGEKMKQGFEHAKEKSKETFVKTKQSMDNIFEEPMDAATLNTSTFNVMNDEVVKAKLNEIEQHLH